MSISRYGFCTSVVPFRASVTSRDESISTSTRNEVMVITEAVVIAGELSTTVDDAVDRYTPRGNTNIDAVVPLEMLCS